MSSLKKWKGMSQFVYHFQLSWGANVLPTTLALASASTFGMIMQNGQKISAVPVTSRSRT